MWDAVRPVGVLAVEDADLEGLFCDLDNDGFSFYRRMYVEVLARNGGDPGCARRLVRYFRETGILAASFCTRRRSLGARDGCAQIGYSGALAASRAGR